MAGKTTPDYIVNTVVEVEDKDSRWTSLGVGFINEKSDTITLLLDGTPVNGKLILKKYEPKE